MNSSTTESASSGQAPTLLRLPEWAVAESTRIAQWLSDLMVLTKARANVAVVATTFVGFALHADALTNWLLLFHSLAGTALVAASAAVANQAREQQFDRRMVRTRHRPIAAGRLRPRTGMWLSGLLCGTGCVWLAAGVNVRAMGFAALAFLVYVSLYTPMKRLTPACTLVGAVSGALPLLIGWAATGAGLGLWASVAFAVLFLWQIPHFLAIAWWRRADYFGAGYRVLCPSDQGGYRTAGWALAATLAEVAVSLVPAFANQVTAWYWPGALAAGILFSSFAVRFLARRNGTAARSLFLASLYYLPAIYVLMLLCRTRS
jgi:protoheme IX farnesyltransferase